MRLERLFLIKDKWSSSEIKSFITDFCDPEIDQKFDTWLGKNTRALKETNPFDPQVSSLYYVKKFWKIKHKGWVKIFNTKCICFYFIF